MEMHPAYFAMAMATGIVSIDCHLLGLREFARLLFWLNALAYGALWVLLIARVALYPSLFLRDWTSHSKAPGFFTAVAATGVLGTQAVLFGVNPLVGRALWWFCLLLWAGCVYGVFVALGVKEEKPSIAEGINGSWLVGIVATQSVCVLGCALGADMFGGREMTTFFLMSFWLFGGMLYIWTITLIFYRYMFFRFSPSDLMPPYWINMGAVAISTLAGAMLVTASSGSKILSPMIPFVKGLTMMYWATATWWIPILVILGVWRHYVRKIGFSYNPLYWGLVFPLGMYSVCTYRLANVLEAPFLLWIARAFVAVAMVAWTMTFFGLAGRVLYALLLAMRFDKSAVAPAGRTVAGQAAQTGGM